MEILAFINQKGGTGKTTTAQNVAAGLTRKRKRVLMIDADPQANLTFITGADYDAPGILEALDDPGNASEYIQHTAAGDILGANPELAAADPPPRQLSKAVEHLQGYDYILIDTQPRQGILTTNALLCASGVIVVAQADALNISGLVGLSGTLDAIRTKNKGLTVWGVVFTRYNERTALNRDAAAAIEDTARQQLGAGAYKTRCRDYVAIREAQLLQKSIFDYAPKSKAAADAVALTAEIMKGRAKNGKI